MPIHVVPMLSVVSLDSSFEKRSEVEMERDLAFSALEGVHFMTMLLSCPHTKQITEHSPQCPPHQTVKSLRDTGSLF